MAFMQRAALLNPTTGKFLAVGGESDHLHLIHVFVANAGFDEELKAAMQKYPHLVPVACVGDWLERYRVKNT